MEKFKFPDGIKILSYIAGVGFATTIVFFFIHLEIGNGPIHPFNTAYLFGGAISGAFSCLSLLGILWTLKKQTEANEQQNKRLEKQQFETTFFSMMNLLQQIVTEIQIYPYKTKYKLDGSDVIEPSSLIIGRESFRIAYESAKMTLPQREYYNLYEKITDRQVFERLNLDDNDIISFQGMKDIINYFGIAAYESTKEITVFDHYFRYLYRIMKFVDESTFLEKEQNSIQERYKYTSILRGTISRYELLWLFYNGLFFDKMKDLMEKYTLLKNIRESLTAQSLDAKTSEYSTDYLLCLVESVEESNSHKPKRDSGEQVIPKYYIGAFLNRKELVARNLEIKQ